MKIVKSIRVNDFTLLEHFLKEIPDLKIISLFRDPRAVHLSQAQYFKMSNATLLCTALNSCAVDAKRLLEKYPKNFHLLRYEDFASHPWKVSQRLLDFLGLRANIKTDTFIHTHMTDVKGKSRGKNVFDTVMKSSAAVSNWRHRTRMPQVRNVQAQCQQAMRVLGYRKISSPKQLFNHGGYKVVVDMGTV